MRLAGSAWPRTHHLPEGAPASFARDALAHTTGEAWRWLGYRWTDPRTGRLRWLPAEHFGPLPGTGAEFWDGICWGRIPLFHRGLVSWSKQFSKF